MRSQHLFRSLSQRAPMLLALGLGLLQGPALATVRATATPPAAGSEAAFQELRFRMQSPRVRELQVRLRQAKYLAVVDVEDRFGMLTREAVLKLQRDAGLRATGVVDRATWEALAARSRPPTQAELNNTDVGPWFVAPHEPAFMM